MSGKALLVLSDGTVFEGRGFGYEGKSIGQMIPHIFLGGSEK